MTQASLVASRDGRGPPSSATSDVKALEVESRHNVVQIVGYGLHWWHKPSNPQLEKQQQHEP